MSTNGCTYFDMVIEGTPSKAKGLSKTSPVNNEGEEPSVMYG